MNCYYKDNYLDMYVYNLCYFKDNYNNFLSNKIKKYFYREVYVF